MTLLVADPSLHPAVARALDKPARYMTPEGARVVVAAPLGRAVYFVIDNGEDRIHRCQARGEFYEQAVLVGLARHLPEGGVFVDIGANIGNHTLFMALHGGAGRVIPIEPNPAAIRLLAGAVRLNRIEDRVELRALGYGLGDADAGGYAIHDPKGNLGWARLTEGGGDIEVRRGDTLLAGEPQIDMIKIDVEGMEIAALSGLEETIARCRPMLFVEVDHSNRGAFDELMARYRYACAEEHKASRVNQNLLMVPEGR